MTEKRPPHHVFEVDDEDPGMINICYIQYAFQECRTLDMFVIIYFFISYAINKIPALAQQLVF